jgi:hypothetical protein
MTYTNDMYKFKHQIIAYFIGKHMLLRAKMIAHHNFRFSAKVASTGVTGDWTSWFVMLLPFMLSLGQKAKTDAQNKILKHFTHATKACPFSMKICNIKHDSHI